MGRCDYCGTEEVPIHTCNHCERTYCSSHRLPEKHDCPLHFPESEAHFESAGPDTSDSESTPTQSNQTSGTDHRPPAPSEKPTPTRPTASSRDTDDLTPREKQLQAQKPRKQKESVEDPEPSFSAGILTHLKSASRLLRGIVETTESYLLKLVSVRILLIVLVAIVVIGGTVGTGVPGVNQPSSEAVEFGGGIVSGTTAWLNQVNDSESRSEEGGETANSATEEKSAASAPFNETALKMEIHTEVNEVREANDLNRLEYSENLESVADRHSEDMATSGYFSHTSPDGVSMSDRYDSANIDCLGAENIWRGTSTFGSESDIAELVVNSWMNSPGHRENILDRHRAEGIGIAIGEYEGDENLFVTQNFCQR